ncbi:MAG: DNA helicase RecQ [Thermoguttaceae bacterium]|nr:DNA helicase RecQ [Thermoguttaceae bacterium]
MEENLIPKVLRQLFGFDSFRPNQEDIVKAILSGRDVFAVMPTGGGKSLCYQFPAVILEGVCIVVSPLLSLMKDQVDSARELGIRAATLNSTTSRKEFGQAVGALENGKLDLLYVSPERFNTPGFLERLSGVKIAFFAIDESHCISEWGHQFRPDYLALKQIVDLFPNIPIAAFTATATPQVAQDIQDQLRLRNPFCVRASFDRPNLCYQVVYKEDLSSQLVSFLKSVPGQSGIIYRGTRKKVEETAEMLTKQGFDARPYHAGMSDSERAWVQDAFSQDRVQIIVATIAFGMGIDKSNVRFVVHADLPKNIEGYYQETGRAGRDGSPSQCLLLFGYQDIVLLKSFIDKYDDPQTKATTWRQLQEMIKFAEADQCRRKALLHYFGEEYPRGNCGNCDFCNDEIHRVDATVDSQKALSAMQRTGNRFGVGHLVDILVGAKTARIKQFKHNTLPTYGVGSDKSKQYWRFLINALIYKGAAAINPNCDYPVPVVTKYGWDIMHGKEQVEVIQFPTLKKQSKRKTEHEDVFTDSIHNDHYLFEQLRQRRKEVALERGVPPYAIFTDKTLLDMANNKPVTEEDMLKISGVGERKMTTYGAAFLELITEYVMASYDESELDPDWREE